MPQTPLRGTFAAVIDPEFCRCDMDRATCVCKPWASPVGLRPSYAQHQFVAFEVYLALCCCCRLLRSYVSHFRMLEAGAPGITSTRKKSQGKALKSTVRSSICLSSAAAPPTAPALECYDQRNTEQNATADILKYIQPCSAGSTPLAFLPDPM